MTTITRANGASTPTPEGVTIDHVWLTLTTSKAGTSIKRSTDAIDMLTERATQLHALLLQTCGASRDNFTGQHESIQEATLWLACSVAEEVNALAEALASGGAA